MQPRPRVLLADDHTLVLDGLRLLLLGEFDVVGSVTNGRDLLLAAAQLDPDVILMDISMPLLNGLDAARQLTQQNCRAKLMFVSMHSSVDYVREAFRAGASGYLIKQAAGTELIQAIREVLNGRMYLTPLVGKDMLSMLLDAGATTRTGSGRLSARQREVLQLVAEGHPAKAIAAMLHISQKTVEFHKASMMKQLGLHSSAELIRYAINQGLVDKG